MTPPAVRKLSLVNVRSTAAAEISVGSGLTILVGPNGAGKTSVLEAASLLLSGRMLRSGSVRDLIKEGQDYLRIEATLEIRGVPVVAAAAYGRSGERRLTADGAPVEDTDRWKNVLGVRTFVPDDLRLIKGSPRHRREFLDELAGGSDRTYKATLVAYEEALTQRNALLRSPWEKQTEKEFQAWERLLARTGADLTAARAAALAGFVASFQHVYTALTGEATTNIKLVYRTNVGEWNEDTYRTRLAESRAADRQRTFTHLGPHRDDLRVLRGGLGLREYGSQGEQRTAVLALVLAEWLLSSEGQSPALLLLDDVMSELDEARRRALVALVAEKGQTIITTTDLRYFTAAELNAAKIVELGAAVRDSTRSGYTQ